jgi:adenine-specific DNA methylase
MENNKKVGRPKKYSTVEQFKEMKSDVMQKLKESGYFKEYYQQKKTEIVKCKYCGMDNLNSINMSNHVKTIKCRRARGEVVEDGRGKARKRNVLNPPDDTRDKIQVYEVNIQL